MLILDEDQIGDFDHFVTDLGGDSLAVIGVIAQLEEKYNLFIPDTEFAKAVNVQDITSLIYKKLYDVDDVDIMPTEEQKEDVKRITQFTETEEYKDFLKRFEDTADEVGRPILFDA